MTNLNMIFYVVVSVYGLVKLWNSPPFPDELWNGQFTEWPGNAFYTPNANMADHSVGARDELHESEASEAKVFCFDNASPEILLQSSVCVSLFYFAMPTSF